MRKQKDVTRYYNRFSKVYNLISSDRYYKKPRKYAIKQLNISKDDFILNIPCGTGVNFKYMNTFLENSGEIIGIDLSTGMLSKAKQKVVKNNFSNISLLEADVTTLNQGWMFENFESRYFDSILCDLGLSGFPSWEKVIDELLLMIRPGGRLVVMDFYIPRKTLRAWYIRKLGKGETNRNIVAYLESKEENVSANSTFKSGDMFVVTVIKK